MDAQTAHIGVRPRYLVIMGVSGTGKTTIASGLATRLGWRFQEGDALHPPANVEKMSAGQPLTDTDRAPWLALCHEWLRAQVEAEQGAVLTCSALKRAYREQLAGEGLPIEFVHIDTSADALAERLKRREGHFMPASLLPSQLATLEVPGDDEPVIRVSGEKHPDLVLEELIRHFQAED
ncbi:gluconokinase [Gluconobacter kanchanaburiensis]|uniref:Gluconokinase n=1 Tax=Gluconobacter kanchanaburiensis NBRC 103587 TaxID=1307948 RepID=A0A511B387_9PROT|nr:gluconokinase [Gluconobacter kanchanaburiensis]GBR70038.1 gluconokinase [Gluconobacter kanchanaburiensis NBRC 103587]GEK94909.1 gluconokinase [Gluconobacter kanchanaburiensis NBRC 103587]